MGSVIQSIARRPRARLVITNVFTLLIAILTSSYVNVITLAGKLQWKLSPTLPVFWGLLATLGFWIYLQSAFLGHDENVSRFEDDAYCLAYIRQQHLEALAERLRKNPSGPGLSDIDTLTKALKIKGGKR